MPKLSNDAVKKPVRILLVGDPGAGKTTAYLHLLNNGHKLFVADLDNGVPSAAAALKLGPEAQANLVFEPLVDRVRPNQANGFPTPVGKPTAWRKFVKLTDKWVDSADATDYGAPESWGTDRTLVIDNLTTLGNAIALAVQDERGALGKKMHPSAVHEGQLRVEGVPQACLSLGCNVIMLAHLAATSAAEDMVLEDKEGNKDAQELKAEAKVANPNTAMRYPYTLGRKLSPRIGAYFTAVLLIKQIGEGRNAKPIISTVSDPDVRVKFPPRGLPAQFEICDLHKVIAELQKN